MREACKFCSIIQGKLATTLVFEDNLSLAFLDHRPLFPGHCLLVPKEHYETLSDLPPALVAPLFANTQLIADAVELGMEAEGTFVAINNRVSQSVPHIHVHIVPRRKGDGLKGFFWPRHPYKDERELHETQRILQAAIKRLQSELR